MTSAPKLAAQRPCVLAETVSFHWAADEHSAFANSLKDGFPHSQDALLHIADRVGGCTAEIHEVLRPEYEAHFNMETHLQI